MAKRPGNTAKISVSIDRDDLKALKQRAKRLHGGNVSAVIAELAADARLLDGMSSLVDWLGGPSLTEADRERVDRELRGDISPPKRRSKPIKGA